MDLLTLIDYLEQVRDASPDPDQIIVVRSVDDVDEPCEFIALDQIPLN